MKRLPLLFLLVAAPALAQMGDMRAMLGRPLPSPQLPAGTVHVRISKQIPINGLPGVEVTAIVAAPGGESRKRTATTNPEGWASFEGLTTGSTFEATATVEGETLKSSNFPIPAAGGTRVMMVAALGAAGGDQAPPGESFAMGSVTGRVAPAEGLPAGTLELTLLDAAGKPIPARVVQLGQVGKDDGVKVLRATSSEAGIARFEGLLTGEAAGYAAIIQHDGMRLGTEPFRMDLTKGMRGEIRALGRISDTSVLRFDNRSKIIFEVGEDALQVMEQLVFKNTSPRMFDPGPEGLMIPLAKGFEGARELEGTTPLDVRAGEGAAVRAAIPPSNGALAAVQVRVGFVLPSDGAPAVKFQQQMPLGLEQPLILVPSSANLSLEAPGLRTLPERADAQGNAVKIYELDDIAPGATLAVTVRGLPALDRTGRNVAGVLCLLLIAGAVAASPRSRKVAQAQATAAQLTERREKLFAELVALEQKRREARAAGKADPAAEERRQELIGKLENVYRELAGVEHGAQALP